MKLHSTPFSVFGVVNAAVLLIPYSISSVIIKCAVIGAKERVQI
jgi:hypothetical protein